MKWYNKSHYSRMLSGIGMDVKLHKEVENYVMKYAKLAFKFMRTQSVEEQVTGILNLQDVMQICFEGLVQGWNRVNWEDLNNKPNWQKSLVNYLSASITGNLKRRIYQEATGVNVPEYQIRKTKAELIADKLFGNWLYSFKLDDILAEDRKVIRYIDMIYWDPLKSSSHDNDNLNEDLTTLMFKYLNDKERAVLRMNFGIDDDKLTEAQIAEKLKMSRRGVQELKKRALAKLNNMESEIILKDFL